MRHVGEQRPERHDELDAEVGRKPGDELRERAPAIVGLDPEHDDRIAIGAGDRAVEELVLGPLDLPRQPLVEGDGRPDGLEVDEALWIDVREPRRLPLPREIARRERCRLTTVVPAAKGRDQHRPAQDRQLAQAKLVTHLESVLALTYRRLGGR